MYSVGVILYELFTGSTDGVQDTKLDGGVWSSVSNDGNALCISQSTYYLNTKLNNQIAAKDMIRGFLNKDPKERWAAKRAKENAWIKL